MCLGVISCCLDGIKRTLPSAPALGHAGIWRGAAAPSIPTKRRKGKQEEEMVQGEGWSEVTLKTKQDRDGLERGVANPGVPGKC